VEQQLGAAAEAVSAQRVPGFDQELVAIALEQFLGAAAQRVSPHHVDEEDQG
jgi:hypothetical protein